VLKLNGIKTLQLEGSTPVSRRPEIINQFKNSTADGPRVLIMSTVGLVGLNLPCANIMIKVVSDFPPSPRLVSVRPHLSSPTQTPQWSKQDGDQLVGRIYRSPQSKTVHVYGLIADDTQDVFLNHICFSKASMMEAFTNTMPSMSMFFSLLFGDHSSADLETRIRGPV
jgi:Helicase conserved C-terminal domain